MPYHVYRHVSVDGETKLRVYKQSEKEPVLRTAILENDLPELDENGERARGPSKVLEAGKKDPDETCRNVAYEKSPRKVNTTPILNALSYSRTAATGLVEIVIAFLVLSSAAAHFEAVMSGLLIIVYVTLRQIGMGHGLVLVHEALSNAKRNQRLLELLHDPKYTRELQEDAQANVSEQEELLRKSTMKMHIEMACLGLIEVSAIIFLIRALWEWSWP